MTSPIVHQPLPAFLTFDGEKPVLEHPAEEVFLELNPTALRIWELTAGPISVDDLVDRLAGEFDVDREECREGTERFLERLRRLGFVEFGEQAPGPMEIMRSEYLELLKKALINRIYPEHELRIRYLQRESRVPDRLEEDRFLRDIRYRRDKDFEELVTAKKSGQVLHREVTRYSHTAIGLKRLNNLHYCAERVFLEEVPGDFLEAGVCQGGAVIFLRALQRAYQQSHRRTWAADSFQGLPKPEAEMDRSHNLDFSEERQPWLAIARRAVEDHFRTYGLLDDGACFLEGWFSETLPRAPIDRLAILRIDADLYQSTRDVLEALYERVSAGGFVIVDDYRTFDPCRSAVDEFRKKEGILDPIRMIDRDGVFWRKSGP